MLLTGGPATVWEEILAFPIVSLGSSTTMLSAGLSKGLAARDKHLKFLRQEFTAHGTHGGLEHSLWLFAQSKLTSCLISKHNRDHSSHDPLQHIRWGEASKRFLRPANVRMEKSIDPHYLSCCNTNCKFVPYPRRPKLVAEPFFIKGKRASTTIRLRRFLDGAVCAIDLHLADLFASITEWTSQQSIFPKI